MAVTNTAVFPQSVSTSTAVTTAANTTLTDSPDNTVALVTFGGDGGELTKLTVLPRATNTAAVAYLYSSTDAGATKRLIRARSVAATTVSTTSAQTEVDFGFGEGVPYRGKAGEVLYVGTSVALANGFAWSAQFRNF